LLDVFENLDMDFLSVEKVAREKARAGVPHAGL
jgi:hypothetical protein